MNYTKQSYDKRNEEALQQNNDLQKDIIELKANVKKWNDRCSDLQNELIISESKNTKLQNDFQYLKKSAQTLSEMAIKERQKQQKQVATYKDMAEKYQEQLSQTQQLLQTVQAHRQTLLSEQKAVDVIEPTGLSSLLQSPYRSNNNNSGKNSGYPTLNPTLSGSTSGKKIPKSNPTNNDITQMLTKLQRPPVIDLESTTEDRLLYRIPLKQQQKGGGMEENKNDDGDIDNITSGLRHLTSSLNQMGNPTRNTVPSMLPDVDGPWHQQQSQRQRQQVSPDDRYSHCNDIQQPSVLRSNDDNPPPSTSSRIAAHESENERAIPQHNYAREYQPQTNSWRKETNQEPIVPQHNYAEEYSPRINAAEYIPTPTNNNPRYNIVDDNEDELEQDRSSDDNEHGAQNNMSQRKWNVGDDNFTMDYDPRVVDEDDFDDTRSDDYQCHGGEYDDYGDEYSSGLYGVPLHPIQEEDEKDVTSPVIDNDK